MIRLDLAGLGLVSLCLTLTSATASAQTPAPVLRNPAELQTQEGRQDSPNEESQAPVISRRVSNLADEALDEQRRRNRRQRDQDMDPYTISCDQILNLAVSDRIISVECATPDRFGDTRYSLYYTPPDRVRESRSSRASREWLGDQLIEMVYEARRQPGARLTLGIIRNSRDPQAGNLWVISSFTLEYEQ